MLNNLNVTLVLDVGANAGQYGRAVRSGGYRGSIVSFEPLSEAAVALMAEADGAWVCHQCAIGSSVDEGILRRSANSWSSSLRPMMEAHLLAAPESIVVGQEAVCVYPLDSFNYAGRIYLKIDTQGYEMDVLLGSASTLQHVVAIELELSPAPLYEGQTLLGELVAWMYQERFRLVSMAPEFYDDRTNEILQFNAIFVHRDSLVNARGGEMLA